MKTETLTISDKAAAFVQLCKPRLTLLVLFSALTGFYLGEANQIEWMVLFHSLFGIALASSGALALNQFIEREHDARMERTRHRPLPEGLLQPAEALVFGVSLSLGSVIFLAYMVNLLTATLVAATIVSYLFAYTPLKRYSFLNTLVGAIPGALPILCGWTAATNQLSIEGWVLFGILFLWQFPHFLSIAILYSDDYEQAGYKMLPTQHNGIKRTHRHILITCIALLMLSVVPTLLGLTGNIYMWVAIVSGVLFLACGIAVVLNHSRHLAKRLMMASFVYPLVLWGFMMIDKV